MLLKTQAIFFFSRWTVLLNQYTLPRLTNPSFGILGISLWRLPGWWSSIIQNVFFSLFYTTLIINKWGRFSEKLAFCLFSSIARHKEERGMKGLTTPNLDRVIHQLDCWAQKYTLIRFPTTTTHLESVGSNPQWPAPISVAETWALSAHCFIFCPQLAGGWGDRSFCLAYSMTLGVLMPCSAFLSLLFCCIL